MFSKQNLTQNLLNPVEKLAFLGNRGIGALEYEPMIESKRNNGIIEVEKLLEVINEIVFVKEDKAAPLNDYHQGLETLVQIGSSAVGQEPKLLLRSMREKILSKQEISTKEKGLIITLSSLMV